jgi:hypothetical protein
MLYLLESRLCFSAPAIPVCPPTLPAQDYQYVAAKPSCNCGCNSQPTPVNVYLERAVADSYFRIVN